MKKLLLAATALCAAPLSANAATLAPDGSWTKFYFDDTGSSITDAATGDLTYDFTLAKAAVLKVTDAYTPGDQFTISNSGSQLFVTGAFDTTGPNTDDPDVAFGGKTYSWGSIRLGPGTYSISGTASTSCCGGGGAFISLAGVPEPATWGLMILGFGAVGGAMRRRSTKVAYA